MGIEVDIEAGNRIDCCGVTNPIASYSENIAGPVGVHQNYSFTGLSSSGQTKTMSYVVEGSAQASHSVLRACVSTRIDNPIFNPDNPKFAQTSLGVPDRFYSLVSSKFQDDVTVSGGPNLASIAVSFVLDGTISVGHAGSAGVGVDQSSDPMPGTWSWTQVPGAGFWANQTTGQTGFVSGKFVTSPFKVGNDGKAHVALRLTAGSDFDLGSETDPENKDFFGSADFSQTLSLTGILGYDSQGNPVPLTTALGDSGTDYLAIGSQNIQNKIDQVNARRQTVAEAKQAAQGQASLMLSPTLSPVPLPGTPPMMGGALAALALLRRRNAA